MSARWRSKRELCRAWRLFFFSSRRRHTRYWRDWSSDVCSSDLVAGAACVGTGVGPREIDEVWGIAKAYSTRVGSGPFPSELDDELGERMRDAGGEFGTTTGRPRRCGWIDLGALRYAAPNNGLTGLVVTKLDV